MTLRQLLQEMVYFDWDFWKQRTTNRDPSTNCSTIWSAWSRWLSYHPITL